MPLALEQVLNNRYRIDECLSHNQVGAVYRAWDMSLRHAVVVKENIDTSPEARRRSKSEATMLTRLSHPNLPRFTDYFFIQRQAHYLAMHFVEGQTLQQKLNQLGYLPETDLLTWFPQICNALAYLHHQNQPLIHGNISPKNIIIRPDGRAILVGGGISRLYNLELRNQFGAEITKPGYSPIELYNGQLPDPLSDIHALAGTMYHLATGELPPNALDRSPNDPPLVFVHAYNQPIGKGLRRAIAKGLESARERRYQNVNLFRAALERAQEGASIYRDALYVFPSSVWTMATGLMLLLMFACVILAVSSFISQTSFKFAGVTLVERPPTATRIPQPTSTPEVIGTPTAPTMQTFRNVGLGFTIEYPYGWRRYEEALLVRFSPTLKGLETETIVDISMWAGASPNEQATPADVLTELLTQFPRNAKEIAQRPISIAGQDWRSIQIQFDQVGQNEPIIAIIAAIRHEEVGYYLVLVAPADEWQYAQPIFRQALTSFKFTKEAEVRFLSEDELPPTPTPTATPVIYIVQSGDSFGRISGLYGVNMQTLAEENDMKLSDYLRVGQELLIPIGYDE
ncbi:protein kinase [Anaerolineales bacterium HSG25]|nr:protein kinase [Anaerolineales bacterium HSG25]